MTTTAQPAAEPTAAPRFSLIRVLAPIARDVAVPIGAYFLLTGLGYSDFTGLLAGTLFSGAVLIIETIRTRRLEPFAAIMLGVFAFGLIGSLISGDPRMMIVKDSAGTAIVGIAFLISTVVGKPLTYLSARKALAAAGPAKLAEFEASYQANPAKRRGFNTLAMAWGVGLVAEATVRILLAYQLPIHTMAWLSPVLSIIFFTPLIALSVRFVKHARRA
ncbi:VC0807 family protein [Nocardia pseudovaccinii]|uniref:VC0807 family protein n=1 Tax=Nocardia pseudovaccinii TaxID=189540 RepID=UPI0007A4F4A1|nr:VC0807 family protein [Nocardia pseudovaccinii]